MEDPKVNFNNYLPFFNTNYLKQVCKSVCTFHGCLPKGSQWPTSCMGNMQISLSSLCAQLNHGDFGGCWKGLVFFPFAVFFIVTPPTYLAHLYFVTLFCYFHPIILFKSLTPMPINLLIFRMTWQGFGCGNVAVWSVAVFIGFWWPLP